MIAVQPKRYVASYLWLRNQESEVTEWSCKTPKGRLTVKHIDKTWIAIYENKKRPKVLSGVITETVAMQEAVRLQK